MSTCPTGYLSAGAVCIGASESVVDLQFDSIGPTIAGLLGSMAVNGATLAYVEASDPIPSKRRGYYFAGSQYVQLPPAPLTSGSPPLFATSFTFSAWIRPQGSGPRTLFSKKEGCMDILTVGISSSNGLFLVLGKPTVSYNHIRPLTIDLWVFVAVSWQFNAATGLTTASFYYDGALHATVYTAAYHIRDSSVSATQMIGVSAAFQDFYYGFIWRITLQNGVLSSFSSYITSVGCPSGLTFCLSACPFSQTPECSNCQAACTRGCVRFTDCSYCQDVLCNSCTGFFTLQCSACIPAAVYTTQCDCVFGRYFSSAVRSCLLCSGECNGCSALTICVGCYSNASLSGNTCLCDGGYFPNTNAGTCSVCVSACLTCASAAVCLTCKANANLMGPNCICSSGFYGPPDHCQPCSLHCQACSASACSICTTGFYLLSGLCTSLCPSGYTLSGSSCIGTNQVVLDLTFDTITSRAAGSSGTAALNGASLAYWPPAFESTDPLPSKHRGYFFSGTQYLQLPPCIDAFGPILTLSPWISFSIWLRPQGSGPRTLYSKASVLSLKLTGSQYIEMQGGVPSTSRILCIPLTVDSWTFLVLTIDMEVSSWQSTVSCYVDAVLVTTDVLPNFYLLDEAIGFGQTIGSSTLFSDFYIGFLWAFSVSNYVLSPISLSAVISSPSCPLGLSFCLSPCPFNETPDCHPCLSTCLFGCVRVSDCSPCSAELCEICSEFESVTCSQCLANTVTSPQCECAAGRYFDRPGRGCELCVLPCVTCSGPLVCLSCVSPATLQGSTCVCPPGFYMPSSGTCTICPASCLECDSTPACTSCPIHSHIKFPTCVCDPQFFGLSTSCQACLSPCRNCLSLSFCSSCYSPAYLQAGSCSCPISYFPNPTAALCTQCPAACFTCVDAAHCTSCWPDAVLYANECICPSGYYGLPSGCVVCGTACVECQGVGCTRCQVGFLMQEKECVAVCKEGYIENKEQLACVIKGKELIATLDGGLFSNLYLNFSSLLGKELNSTDFSTVLTTSDGITITTEHTLTALTANQHYNVSLLISTQRTTQFPVFLSFLAPISASSGSLLTTPNLSTTLTITPKSQQDPSTALVPASSLGTAVTQSAVVSGLVGSMLTGNVGSLFTMLNNIQLLAYLPLSGVALPAGLCALLKSLNMQTVLPSPFEYVLHGNETGNLPGYAEQYGYTSVLFLSNAGLAITAGVLTALYALASLALSKCPVRFFALYFGTAGKANYMTRYWIQVYLDISLAAYLQVFAVQLASPTLAVNFCLGLLAAVLCVATPFCVLYITLRYRTETSVSAGKWWSGLFVEFKLEKSLFGRCFYTLFFFRRLLYSTSLLTLHSHPVYQSISFLLLSLCVTCTQSLGHLIVYRPYIDLPSLIATLSSEFCVASVFSLSAAYNFPLSPTVSKALEQACTGLVFTTLAGANAVMVYTAVATLKRVWGQYVKEVKKSKGVSAVWTTSRKTAW